MKKQYWYLLILCAILVGLMFFGTPVAAGESSSTSYEADYGDGGVNLKAVFLDENGQVVEDTGLRVILYNMVEQAMLSVYTVNGTRIRWVQVTVEWVTVEIQAGFDTAQFQFNATLFLDVQGDNGAIWTFTYDVTPAGAPDIMSSQLNGTQAWTLDLKLELGLEDDAAAHGSVDPTTYDLTFTLTWSAKMWDMSYSAWETQDDEGAPPVLTVSCLWKKTGFKVKPKLS